MKVLTKAIIKIYNGQVFYTKNDHVDLNQTNFSTEHSVFRNGKENYYEVEIVSIDKNEKILYLDFKFARFNCAQFFNEQTRIGEFENVKFDKIHLDNIEVFSMGKNIVFHKDYVQNKIEKVKIEVDNEVSIPTNNKKIDLLHHFEIKNADIISSNETIEEPVSKKETQDYELETFTLKKKFQVYFKDAEFKDGYVLVKKKIDFHFYLKKVELKIYNDQIISEYNYIRNYFGRIFSKKFNVETEIQYNSNSFLGEKTTSIEIEKINEDIINRIKDERTAKVIKIKVDEDEEKAIFSVDELLSKINTKEGGNIFKQDGEDVLKTLLNYKDIRSVKQFQYLGGLKHNMDQNIQFTLTPNFGFLFYVKGRKMDHFCWELLDSHATYIWSMEKEKTLENVFSRINQTLFSVKTLKRNKYKKMKKNGEIDTDLNFNIIIHKKVKIGDVDNFIIWKNKVNEILI